MCRDCMMMASKVYVCGWANMSRAHLRIPVPGKRFLVVCSRLSAGWSLTGSILEGPFVLFFPPVLAFVVMVVMRRWSGNRTAWELLPGRQSERGGGAFAIG